MGSVYKRKGSAVWQVQWVDHTGKPHRRSSKTTSKAQAEHLLSRLEAETWMIANGLLDVREVATREAAATGASQIVEEYLRAASSHATDRTLAEKKRHLERLIEEAKIVRLGDLTAEALRTHMRRRVEAGASHADANHTRKEAVAMMNWLKKAQRIAHNPLAVVAKLDTESDRHKRYRRRPLSDEEVAALLAVAREADERLNAEAGRAMVSRREAWYAVAVYAGLRKGDLERLVFGDIDLSKRTLAVRNGKGKRTAVLPINDELAAIIGRAWPSMAHPWAIAAEPVFAEVTDETRRNDFERARVRWIDQAVGQAAEDRAERKRRAESRFMLADGQGRVIDLHALRATFATKLARLGVPPAELKRLMRHASIETTLQFYTHLDEADDAAAVAMVSFAGKAEPGGEAEASTG